MQPWNEAQDIICRSYMSGKFANRLNIYRSYASSIPEFAEAVCRMLPSVRVRCQKTQTVRICKHIQNAIHLIFRLFCFHCLVRPRRVGLYFHSGFRPPSDFVQAEMLVRSPGRLSIFIILKKYIDKRIQKTLQLVLKTTALRVGFYSHRSFSPPWILLKPKYRLGHPENYLFSLPAKKIWIKESKKHLLLFLKTTAL